MKTKPRVWRQYLLLAIILPIALIITECSHESTRAKADRSRNEDDWNDGIEKYSEQLFEKGKDVFRFESFGDESFWTDKLQLHKAIEGSKYGGVGPGLTPKMALELGFKVDLNILPEFIKEKIKEGKFLDDVWVTLQLLRVNAVLGVVSDFNKDGSIKSIGVTCAVCHSTVKDSSGIGHRLDGWPNEDLNVGEIIALAPDLSVYENLLSMDAASIRKVLKSWGPGKFDAELNLDGKGFRPDGKSAATRIPPAFGTAGKNNHTWGGGWGTVTYWNAYVANLELQGNGNFFDHRLMNEKQYPIAAKAGFGNKRSNPDMVSDKLASLHYYQLSIPPPKAPKDTYNETAANRGKIIFDGKATCSRCHVPPLFTEPGWNTHKPEDIGIDDFQSNRSPDHSYVTPSLRGLWAHSKRGFYHDGRFATLHDVVAHYKQHLQLSLSADEENDLIEYIKSL
jgi:hypothetical protein